MTAPDTKPAPRARTGPIARRLYGFERLPIESARPVVTVAVARLALPVGGLIATAAAGFPFHGDVSIVLAALAIPWALLILVVMRTRPSLALSPYVAVGDLAVLAALQAAAADTYAAVHFLALVFVAVHAHLQGPRRGFLIALGATALLVPIAAVATDVPVHGGLLALYESLFGVSAVTVALLVGELRRSESAGRLRARRVTRRMLEREGEVRRKVAQSIHDGPVQELVSLDMMLGGAGHAASRGDTARAATLIEQARELTERNIQSLRDEIVGLGPYAFEELSFETAVEQCIAPWKRRYNCDVRLETIRPGLSPEAAENLFRIVQEAVVNACRHGDAKNVLIALRRSDGALELLVRDDGTGFGDVDPLGPHDPGHLGLAGIRERAEALGGSIDITSGPGQTELLVSFPAGAG